MGSFENPNLSRGVLFNKNMMGRLLVPPTSSLGGQEMAGEPEEGEDEPACSPAGRLVFDLLGISKTSTGACPEGLPLLALTRKTSLPSSLIKSL